MNSSTNTHLPLHQTLPGHQTAPGHQPSAILQATAGHQTTPRQQPSAVHQATAGHQTATFNHTIPFHQAAPVHRATSLHHIASIQRKATVSASDVFELHLLQNCPSQLSICFGCGQSLKPGVAIGNPPYDLVVVSRMPCQFVNHYGNKLSHEENVYFHALSGCIKQK